MIQTVRAQGRSAEGFNDKIKIVRPFKIPGQPHLLRGNIRRRVTQLADDIFLISEPDNGFGVAHPDRPQADAKTLNSQRVLPSRCAVALAGSRPTIRSA